MTREQIIAEARRLDPAEQARIAEELWLGLEGVTRHEVEEAWRNKSEQRIDARDSGRKAPLGGHQVFSALDAELDRVRNNRA